MLHRIVIFLWILFISCYSFAGVSITYPLFKADDSNGDPLSGGLLYTYIAGTNTEKATYSDKACTIPNPNPVVLNSRGEAAIYGLGTYKFKLYSDDDGDATPDTLIWTYDNYGNEDFGGSERYYPSSSASDQGITGSNNTIKYYVDTIGSTNKATIFLKHDSGSAQTIYTLTTSLTIPANITIEPEPGAIINGASILAFASSPDAQIKALPGQQVFGSTLTVTFGVGGTKYPNWWATNTTPGTTDMRTAIQSAINSGTGTVKFLDQTYLLTKGAAKTDEAGANYACLTMLSNRSYIGTGQTILKLANNQSSDAASINIAMFLSIVPLSDITFNGITFDMNGANNGINGTAWTFAHILFSGTTAGVAARGDNITIKYCKFINTPGVTCIGMAQSNTSTITLGNNWLIDGNYFNNNGLDSTDHSSIYAYAKKSKIINNTFTQDAMYDHAGGGLGMRSAIELHAADTIVKGNIIENSWLGMYVSTTYVTLVDTERQIISENTINVARTGVYFSRAAATDAAIHNILISNNVIDLADVNHGDAIPKAGVEIASNYGVSNVKISNNTIRANGATYASAGFIVACPTAGQSHAGIEIINNKTYLTTYGTYSYNNVGSVKDIKIEGNTWYDLIDFGAAVPVGVFLANAGAITTTLAVIKNNTAMDINGVSAADIGIYLDGLITNLIMSGNEFYGMSANVTNTATITNFTGEYQVITTVYDPPNIAAGATLTVDGPAVAGAKFGDIVEVAAPYDLQGIIAAAYVQSANDVYLVLHNPTAGDIDLGSGTWKFYVRTK